MNPKDYSHFDALGKARMVDISEKPVSTRYAKARGEVHVQSATLRMIERGMVGKGDVVTVAKLAGIQGAKRTAELIPMCHPLLMDEIKLNIEMDASNNKIDLIAEVKCVGKTGAEMEALTAVAIAALTVYDMVKSGDRKASLQNIRLVEKSGGKSGDVLYEK
jgi:cyclic pyranopterin phosphate synthase